MMKNKNNHSRIKVTKPNGEVVSPTCQKKLQKKHDCSFSPVTNISSSDPGYSTGTSTSGRKFHRFLNVESNSNRELSMWFEEENYADQRLKTSSGLSSPPKVEQFKFFVPSKAKTTLRDKSQNQIKKCSAKAYLVTEGVKVGRHKMHWGHRQACMLGGKQVSENLDPITAACNIDTLHLVENNLYRLRRNKLRVNGAIHFLGEVPQKLEYKIISDKASVNVILDPLSTMKATRERRYLTEEIVKSALTANSSSYF